MYPLYHLTLLTGLSSALLLPGDSLDVPDAHVESRAGCPKLQIVALGGEGTTVGDLGYLQSTVDGIMSAIPAARLFQIGYPPGADSPTAIASGTPQLKQHVHHFAKRCPNSKMAIVGYSAGAACVMDVLCGDVNTGQGSLPTDFRHHIIANVVYGDPTFVVGKPYNVGTCTQSGEVPRAFPQKCFPFGKKLRSYCTEGDQVCCSGDDESVHFTYPGQYDGEVAQFVKAKWNYYKGHR